MINEIINRYDEYDSIDIRDTQDYERAVKLKEQLYDHDLPWLIEYLRRNVGGQRSQ